MITSRMIPARSKRTWQILDHPTVLRNCTDRQDLDVRCVNEIDLTGKTLEGRSHLPLSKARRFITPQPPLPVTACRVPTHPHQELIWRYPQFSRIAITTRSTRSRPRMYRRVA